MVFVCWHTHVEHTPLSALHSSLCAGVIPGSERVSSDSTRSVLIHHGQTVGAHSIWCHSCNLTVSRCFGLLLVSSPESISSTLCPHCQWLDCSIQPGCSSPPSWPLCGLLDSSKPELSRASVFLAGPSPCWEQLACGLGFACLGPGTPHTRPPPGMLPGHPFV